MGDNNENTEQPQPPNPFSTNPQLPKPPSILGLIAQNLNQLRGIVDVYSRIPRLPPMLEPPNAIINNVQTVTEEHNTTLLW